MRIFTEHLKKLKYLLISTVFSEATADIYEEEKIARKMFVTANKKENKTGKSYLYKRVSGFFKRLFLQLK